MNKHSLIILSFFLSSAAVLLYSLVGNWDGGVFSNVGSAQETPPESSSESYFKEVTFYYWKERKPVLQLDSIELISNDNTKKIYFLEPEGFAVSNSGEKIFYDSKKGTFDNASKFLQLYDDVKVKTANSNFNSDQINYDFPTDKLVAVGKVKTKSYFESTGDDILVNSNTLISYPKSKVTTYYGDVSGRINRSKVYEQGISFKSKQIDMDLNTGKVHLKDDVFIKKQQLRASSKSGDIFLENYNKRLKYFTLYDDVKVVETVTLGSGANKETFDRKAFSEKLEGTVSESKVVLTGYPKVIQRDDLIKGNVITLRENSEVVEVEDANTNFKLK